MSVSGRCPLARSELVKPQGCELNALPLQRIRRTSKRHSRGRLAMMEDFAGNETEWRREVTSTSPFASEGNQPLDKERSGRPGQHGGRRLTRTRINDITDLAGLRAAALEVALGGDDPEIEEKQFVRQAGSKVSRFIRSPLPTTMSSNSTGSLQLFNRQTSRSKSPVECSPRLFNRQTWRSMPPGECSPQHFNRQTWRSESPVGCSTSPVRLLSLGPRTPPSLTT
eukprot:TRINITY_DN69079_c0_g1_i1.p1 TRINITY_DN69079_c0_g1~~TRINITY_DN69079_c0_g1_i1.p1  ORF type:complete len:225 (-),score=13.93 TRINITY_DN69079_c0_g1_i1:124-798(-)